LNTLFGTTKVAGYHGQHQVWSPVELRAVDSPRPELTLAGVQAASPSALFAFELMTTDFATVSYSNGGPQHQLTSGQSLLTDGRRCPDGC
jgi:hypothetical protein